MKIEVYSTPNCPYCVKVKNFLNQEKFDFIEYDVSKDKEKRKEMVDKSDQMSVPVTVIDGKVVIGFIKVNLAKALKII